jgi:ferredoxin-thioredoxin reductase catalytic subunit
MNSPTDVTSDEILSLFDRLKKEAEASGYHLNPDETFTGELLKGLIVNQKRYGYGSCPCRLSEGDKWKDLDIICPCDYRDPDLSEFGACYCALYVSQDVVNGKTKLESVPERRLSPEERQPPGLTGSTNVSVNMAYPVWRCKVCGYLCARDAAPDLCPICKAARERFERFL